MQQKLYKQKGFWFSILSSLLLFVSIAEGQKIFAELWLLHEMIQLLVFLFFAGTLTWSIVFWVRRKKEFKHPFVPFSIHAFIIFIVLILPVNWLRNKIEFNVYRDEFNKAAAFVMATEHEVKGHPQIDELPAEYKHLSLDGVVFVIHRQNTKGIFFFTFRGAPDGLAGYLKIQNGASLDEYIKAISREEHLVARDLGDNWYYLNAE